MKIFLTILAFTTLSNIYGQNVTYDQKNIFKTKFDYAVPVLNVATFHMGGTFDASSTEFDEFNEKNQIAVRKVARLLAEFKPTIIVIEDLSQKDSLRNIDYLNYVKDPAIKFKKPTEIELLAYEVGRLSGTSKIYGIDFKEAYNYNIADELKNTLDTTTVNKYWEMLEENEKNNPEKGISFYDLFKLNNHPQYLESLIVINADLLTYSSTKGKSEGADEASKFYHRNLVMFSNFNQIPINAHDRIFILMGGTHTAFFNDFIKRSPKYKLEKTFEYLK
jgi:hypothetical protein